MEDNCKMRMNLAAVKKVDPYAKDIIDTSSHVAFYTFNAEQNEWEKTDVEGAFFIYSRNAQPFQSIFINNRLNTNSFVEPITSQFELQSQPPFLLYRNERSRIRGFWFYNSNECERITKLVTHLVENSTTPSLPPNNENERHLNQPKQTEENIFNLLQKAQREYNLSKGETNLTTSIEQNQPPRNVLKFFAAAKPTVELSSLKQPRSMSNTLSVEQLEKQQRNNNTQEEKKANNPLQLLTRNKIESNNVEHNNTNKLCVTTPIRQPLQDSNPIDLVHLFNLPTKQLNTSTTSVVSKENESSLHKILISNQSPIQNERGKPALMPPTMFETPVSTAAPGPLNQKQLIQALNYLLQNDEEFVKKIHEAYLKSLSKTIIGTC